MGERKERKKGGRKGGREEKGKRKGRRAGRREGHVTGHYADTLVNQAVYKWAKHCPAALLPMITCR